MEDENKKTTFLFVFSTYLSMCLLKFLSRELVRCGIKFCIQQVHTRHTFDGPHYPKNNKYLKKMEWWFFSGISCFWGSGVHQKYAEWVLVGCKIYFRIQWALLIKIWVKTQGDMLKIQTKKISFFYDTYPQIYI